MAISRINAVSAQAATVSFTAPAVGDVILVFAHRDGSTTVPTIPATYQKIASAGANTNSAIIGYRISDGTETSTGTWTNATSICAGIYRGVDPNTPVGGYAPAGSTVANNGTMSYAAVTMFRGASFNTSWVVGMGAGRATTNVGTNAPSGMGTRTSATDIALFDTGGTATSWSAQTAQVTASSTLGYRTYTVELLARNASSFTDPLVQCVSTMPTGESGNTFICNWPNATLANNLLVMAMSWSHGATVSSISDANGAWTPGKSQAGDGAATVKDSAIYYKAGAAAAGSVTVVFSGTVANFHFVMAEFTGAATSSVVDGTATSADNVLNATGIQPGSITTTADGDLIFNYATQVLVDAWQSNSVYCIGISADPALRLLAASRAVEYGAQYGIQASHGAINPLLVAKCWTTSEVTDMPFQSLAIAFKMDGSGTAPAASGIRIIRSHSEQHPEDSRTSSPIQLVTSGNLLVGITSDTLLNTEWTAMRDSVAGAWTAMHKDEVTDLPHGWYLAGASAASDRYCTTTFSGTARHWMRFYDVIGADASAPYDTSAGATGALSAPNQSISNSPSITPGTSNGLVFAIASMGDGPTTAITAPSGSNVFYESHRYTGETDAGYMNEGDGFGHVYNANTSTLNFTWTTAAPTNSAWATAAFTFKGAVTAAPIYQSGPIKMQAVNRASTY